MAHPLLWACLVVVGASEHVVLQNEKVILTVDSSSLELTSLTAHASAAPNVIGTSALWSAQFVVGGHDGAQELDSGSAACASRVARGDEEGHKGGGAARSAAVPADQVGRGGDEARWEPVAAREPERRFHSRAAAKAGR